MIPPPASVGPPPERAATDESSLGSPYSAEKIFRVVGFVVGPTTLITALLYYFGWARTNAQMGYFGVDTTALGFSMQDYLLRSIDALFVPVALALVLVLLGIIVYSQLSRVHRRHGLRRALMGVPLLIVGLGVFLIAFGTYSAFVKQVGGYIRIPTSFLCGTVLLTYAVVLRKELERGPAEDRHNPEPQPPGMRVALGISVGSLLVLCVFWVVAVYANDVGNRRATQASAGLAGRTSVTVFSSQRLDLVGRGVVETASGTPNAKYPFRYSGLKLLLRANGKYFLLPSCWTRDAGQTFVLNDTEDLRYEFARDGAGCMA